MYGGTITGGNSGNDAGGVYVGGTFTMHDGTITSGTAAGGGGNLRVNGTFIMNAGLITEGKANATGGNITIPASGKVYINGGVISNGLSNADATNGGSGGNIYINGDNAELIVKNATIKDGGALNGDRHGGNIAVTGKGAKVFLLGEGAIITGGKGHRAGNLYIGDLSANYDTYVIDGATISDGTNSYRACNINMHQPLSSTAIKLTIKSGTISLADDSTARNIALGAGGSGEANCIIRMENGTVNGGIIDLFKGCVFEFISGTLSNYTKTGNGTMVFAD
jgi:hypothetical protein